MSAFEQALAAWRQNPSAPSTVALCSYLGPSQKLELVREVGERASTWHVNDAGVMLAVGRMYLDANLLPEAQVALTQAGKIAGPNAEPHRFLGEVLLRRGDAVRAERVLSRAIELGGDDAECRGLHDRATFYMPLQKRVGAQAVATEVARALPKHPSLPPFGPGAARLRPSFDTDTNEISDVVELDDMGGELTDVMPLAGNDGYRTPLPISARAGGLPSLGGMAARRTASRAPSSRSAPPPAREAEPSYEDVSDYVDDAASLPSFADYELPSAPAQRAPGFEPLPAPPPPVPPPPVVLRNDAAPRSSVHDVVRPGPGLVLEHLARVGIYEPRGGAAPLWERAPQVRARGSWLLVAAIVLVSAGGGGAYEYSRRLQAARVAEAAALNADVEKQLASGRVAALKASDEKLARSFDLDSRSQRAARLWLENRVLGALLLGTDVPGVDAAVHRGRATGLPEAALAAGRVASFYVEGDLAGAAALLPKWDRDAGRDAVYQLAAGAVLERAGDARAAERYEAARRAAPGLVPAGILLARLVLLEHGPEKAQPLLEALRSRGVEPVALDALDALRWALDPNRSPDAAPASPTASAATLPAPLRIAAPLAEAVAALGRGELEAADRALERGLGFADSPAACVAFGSLALDTGNEQLARKAALRALGFSALYPGARALAARVALLGGRLDEAQKATEGLEPSSKDVAVVRAAVAYEKLELSDLASARDALGGDESAPAHRALALAPLILSGAKSPSPEELRALAQPSIAWGELVAIDAALDGGNLELASTLLGRRPVQTLAPAHRARLARLHRYRGELEPALAASNGALESSPTPASLIERSYELVEADRAKAAKELAAKYPTVLGSLAAWLGVLTDVAANQPKLAALRLAKLEPPPNGAPVVERVLAARALVAAGDKRAKAYTLELSRTLRKHPDVLLAVESLK